MPSASATAPRRSLSVSDDVSFFMVLKGWESARGLGAVSDRGGCGSARFGVANRELDLDGPEGIVLEQERQPEPRHLEQREKRRDELRARGLSLEQIDERDAPPLLQELRELVDAIGDR